MTPEQAADQSELAAAAPMRFEKRDTGYETYSSSLPISQRRARGVGAVWSSLVVMVGSLVCVVLIVASVAVGFSFLVVPILVAELMLLAAVYLVRRALEPEAPAPDMQRAWYVGGFVCLLVIVSSIAVGLSFLVMPIVAAELILLGAVYLARQTLWPEASAGQRSPAWYAPRGYRPSPATERFYERHRLGRAAGSGDGAADAGEAPPARRRVREPYRLPSTPRPTHP